MQIQFLLGPAGSGKTFRCLTEARRLLRQSAEGPLLVFVAPKQATFQLERHLLAEEDLPGWTRLRVLSFERLAELVFEQLGLAAPNLLNEEGRVMVLRALLSRRQNDLKLFRSSARLPGFARQLSLLMRELRHHRLGPQKVGELACKVGPSNRLDHKLRDVALLLESYGDWLATHNLQDSDSLLDLAADALARAQAAKNFGDSDSFISPGQKRVSTAAGSVVLDPASHPANPLQIEALWADGFAQMTPQEYRFMAALMPFCKKATLAFCFDSKTEEQSWFSPWSIVRRTFSQLHAELSALPGCTIQVEHVARDPKRNRFASQPLLQHLESHWAVPLPPNPEVLACEPFGTAQAAVRIVACANPEAEALMTARDILRYVRSGGRYRDTAVLLRQLEQYHDPLRRAFLRYGIPFFLDRREPVGHHPLAELTRGALRTVAHNWRSADWFTALKSGLVHGSEPEIDKLENDAIANGWEGQAWRAELKYRSKPSSREFAPDQLEALRQKLIRPFAEFAKNLEHSPSGGQLADAVRALWASLRVHETLEKWSATERPAAEGAIVIHTTVWKQLNEWLDNVALAFAGETLPLSQWLSILESGLGALSIGLVPPVLDQVLIGSVDRSRNPDLQRVFILGMNETVFPAPVASHTLLSEVDRLLLDKAGHPLGNDSRVHLGMERFLAYIACTRARRRVIVTYAQRDSQGRALNPSCFVSHLERLFPPLANNHEKFNAARDWTDCDHAADLLPLLLESQGLTQTQGFVPSPALKQLAPFTRLPEVTAVLDRLKHLHQSTDTGFIDPRVAHKLYGPALDTSVSQFEKFAACPFQFFVSSGLQAEERLRYELDIRQQGSFQHEVLAKFHEDLRVAGKRWRDLTPAEARNLIAETCASMLEKFEDGLLTAKEQNRFLAESYKQSLQRLIETLVGWMQQYQFDPEVVEIGFGFHDSKLPAWRIDLGQDCALLFRGRIDRVDLWRKPGHDEALCVVIDYKSSQRKLKQLYIENGLQQQLPAYLNVLRHLENGRSVFGVNRLIPAGVFYINLAGSYEFGETRADVLNSVFEDSRRAYTHEGLFNADELDKLDNRTDVSAGDQFRYSLKKDGHLAKKGLGPLSQDAFSRMLDESHARLVQMGRSLYQGDVRIDPYKCGNEVACEKCDYGSICRIDPWSHKFRTLKAVAEPEE